MNIPQVLRLCDLRVDLAVILLHFSEIATRILIVKIKSQYLYIKLQKIGCAGWGSQV
jgi:hypothetical protein